LILGSSFILDETYEGEKSKYGIGGWRYVMKILHLGSEFALDLIKYERKRHEGNGFIQPLTSIGGYISSLISCQLGLMSYGILFELSIHR